MPTPYLAAAIAIIVSAVSVRILLRAGLIPDKPNERSLHTHPTPRSGGVGILAGILLSCWLADIAHPVIWIASGVALLSLLDDRWSLSTSFRLIAHVVASTLFVISLGSWSLPWTVPLLVLALVWMTNLYNFMDGADGLAGGMAVIGFGAYAIAASSQGHTELTILALCIAAAAAGFMFFNYPPARIFMGDVGSIPLGFLAGAVGLMGWHEDVWPLIFPLIVFAPFVVDATVTLLRRALRKERVWQAHREHYYQRLILSGWTHRRLAIAEYAIMLICAIGGLTLIFVPRIDQVFVAVALGLVLLGLMIMVDRRWRLFTRADHA